MDKNTKYVLIAVVIIGILYLLYKNRSESLSSESSSKQKSEDNNQKNKKSNTKLSVYYTNWCGYSQRFNKDLDDGLENAINKLNVPVERVDCEKNKNLCESLGIPGYPTVLLHKEDKIIQYNGDRSKTDLLNFVTNNM
jgi:hypothetical protein